ncbi:major facilitator superfamily domain-containing protein [Dissophora ornata]|nr:major facilitator superfamily domain-containing protein [Dissophora ornata]
MAFFTLPASWRPYLLAGSFICACLNMLASGSLYVFALYAPSFTGRLGYSQTQTSAIAVIGDIGLYGVGPVSGLMADRLGPRPTSFIAGSLLALGYGLLSSGYANGLESVKRGEPPTHFLLMALYLFLAGMGSSASYMASFTSLAKNFKQARGIALGIPVSFFGLSAAALTLVAQSFFIIRTSNPVGTLDEAQDLDTRRFLLFLGVFAGTVNFLSVIGMNIIPAPELTGAQEVEDEHTVASSLLQEAATPVRDVDEQTPLIQDNTSAAQGHHSNVPSISGKAFFLDRDAQAFFVVMVCLAGTGLMIINSISAMVDAVAAYELAHQALLGFEKAPDEGNPIASMRAKHVAIISLSSYVGRILSGLGSDIAIHRYGAHRINILPVATACMALAQAVGMFASLQWLYLCSILTGLAYGGFFGVAGIIVAELWGEETCGQNWGWLSWGSAIGGMLFNILFGVVMDAARPVVDGEPQVCKGRGCFRWALFVSFVACVVSCLISIVMGMRQKQAAARRP